MDRRDRDVQVRPLASAAAALVVPEVRHVGPAERQRVLAVHAADRVRRVLGDLRAHAFRAEAEVQAANLGARGEARHQRVVSVQHRAAVPGQCLDGGLQHSRHRVQLAETVQLVAEDVGDEDHVRRHLRRHSPHRRLVDFQQQQLRPHPPPQVGSPDGDRGHALEQVRPGPVLGNADAGRLRQGGQHPAGRRLAVAPRDRGLAGLARRGDLLQHERVHPPGDGTGKACSAADVQEPARGARPLARREREREPDPSGGDCRCAGAHDVPPWARRAPASRTAATMEST